MIIIFVLLTSSCGLFEPRNDQEPENPAEWISYPINREQVLQNLIFSYKYPENQNNYDQIFTDDFIFNFASQDVPEHGTPVDLNYQEEASIIFNMHKILGDFDQKIVIDTLVAIEGQDDIVDSSSATLYRNYYLKITKIDSETEIKSYQGKAEFYLIQDNETSLWKIESWKDYRTNSNQTWGLLKNDYLY